MAKLCAAGPTPRRRTLPLFAALTVLPLGCIPDGPAVEEVPFVLPGTLVETAEYSARRQRLMDEVPDGIAIIPGATSLGTSVFCASPTGRKSCRA